MITKFLEFDLLEKKAVKIEFKKRNSIVGIFVKSYDYEYLKSKNFWRIVADAKMKEWKTTNDNGLSKIFSGSEFTRLTMAKEQ